MDEVFKAYDVRGTVPDQLDAGMCRAIGRAMARFAGVSRVLVARDMRESGVELSAAFSDGVRAEGVNVTDLGLASTDFLYFASGHLDAPGAMFTASHNPAQYNGLKLCLSGARPIGRDTGLAEIEAVAEELLGAPLPALSGTLSEKNLLGEWADHVVSFVDVGSLRPLKVVADTANGMGGLVVPVVFERLPFSVEILFPELDGTFPNHPADPIQPENLVALKAAVLEHGADIGLAFDGDADRVFLVDEKAEPVSGSLTTALVAASMLTKHPGETILYNLICSHVVPEVVTELGGDPVRTQVGHSIIKKVMADTGAVFGGEHSGHYYYRDNFRADSGIITALLVLELLSQSAQPLSEMLQPYQRYVDSGEINTTVSDPAASVEAIAAHEREAGASVDRLDGLTVEHDDWWYNVRPSNTEPLLRLNVEAKTSERCAAHVAEVQELITAAAHAAASANASLTAGPN
jgi:phosphomannomutase